MGGAVGTPPSRRQLVVWTERAGDGVGAVRQRRGVRLGLPLLSLKQTPAVRMGLARSHPPCMLYCRALATVLVKLLSDERPLLLPQTLFGLRCKIHDLQSLVRT